jgi:hypothetical protein
VQHPTLLWDKQGHVSHGAQEPQKQVKCTKLIPTIMANHVHDRTLQHRCAVVSWDSQEQADVRGSTNGEVTLL